MVKNLFIISSIILAVVLVFFGIYNFAFNDIDKLKEAELLEDGKEKSKTVISENYEKITAISEEPVIGVTLDSDGRKIIFYDKRNGNVIEISFDGTVKKLIFENNLNNLMNVLWSPDKNFVISSFGNDIKKKFYLYSYITRKSIELREDMDQIVWDNQGEKIIYKYFNEENGERSLNIADPNGRNWEQLVPLSDKFKKIDFAHVPQTLFVSFWNYPNYLEETSLNRISLLEGNKEEVLKGRFGANYSWSPNGRKILISSVDNEGNNLRLEVGDIDNAEYKDLGMPTLVDKCVWSDDGENIFCAMPSNIPNDSRMPNDYQDNKLFTKDTFWKISIASGKKERIVELEELRGEYDAYNLLLSPKEDILFFINKYDDKLYRIIL